MPYSSNEQISRATALSTLSHWFPDCPPTLCDRASSLRHPFTRVYPHFTEQQSDMSHSPATPNKNGQHPAESSPKSGLPSTENLTSTTKIQRASLHEPSPASTYGGTTGSSVPATPQDIDPLSMYLLFVRCISLALFTAFCPPNLVLPFFSLLLLHTKVHYLGSLYFFVWAQVSAMHASLECMSPFHVFLSTMVHVNLQLTVHVADFNQDMLNLLKATYTDPAIESIYGSPARSRGRKSSTHSDRQAGRVLLVSYTSPSSKQQIGGVVISHNTSTNSSPRSDRLRLIQQSPSWRAAGEDEEVFKREAQSQAETFVKRAGNEADDVFGSPACDSQSPHQGKSSAVFVIFSSA